MQRQAVTDELTGLFNHRRFQEVMDQEVERAQRFGHDAGPDHARHRQLQAVNDTYGHQQGDLVLREVARVLRESSREIDEPARYGGEEMAVALPADRPRGRLPVRRARAHGDRGAALPLLDGDGALRVTASFGAAASARHRRATRTRSIAAADAALYRAKRAGKNRTVRAEKQPASRSSGVGSPRAARAR